VILDMAFVSRLTHGEAPSNHVSVGSERFLPTESRGVRTLSLTRFENDVGTL
jgi:hypothetical protein